MPAETFFCPACRRQLTKSAQAYVLGEMMGQKDASFIALGSLAETVTCPGCGAGIDTRKMISGAYDRPAGGGGCLEFLAGLVACYAAAIQLGWPWWGDLAAGLGVALLVGWIRARLRGSKSP